MTMSSDEELASYLAEGAGALLVRLRDAHADSDQLRTMGDLQSHAWLMEQLARLCPDDSVLSEEGADDPARLGAERVWIVDPLDGTREFGEAGRTDWAVHVALWERGELSCGAVALPARGVVYSSDMVLALPERSGPIRLAVSRSRPPSFVTELAEHLGAVLVPMGSAGVKGTSVATGEVDAYVHAGGQFEWDSAAPVAVARGLGLHTSRIDGSPLRYNQPNPRLPDLVIARPEVAERVLTAVASIESPFQVNKENKS
ncbi:MAG: 3'(2'),5'-bisphosphate nucleotidase CysQ [Dermatophilaceae bacterium]